jgi:hypothetical protein
MSMSKQDFIALADAIKDHNAKGEDSTDPQESAFDDEQLEVLAVFCKRQNPDFNRSRWFGYIRGKNGPSGGKR